MLEKKDNKSQREMVQFNGSGIIAFSGFGFASCKWKVKYLEPKVLM